MSDFISAEGSTIEGVMTGFKSAGGLEGAPISETMFKKN
jgi:hypothetical protein